MGAVGRLVVVVGNDDRHSLPLLQQRLVLINGSDQIEKSVVRHIPNIQATAKVIGKLSPLVDVVHRRFLVRDQQEPRTLLPQVAFGNANERFSIVDTSVALVLVARFRSLQVEVNADFQILDTGPLRMLV